MVEDKRLERNAALARFDQRMADINAGCMSGEAPDNLDNMIEEVSPSNLRAGRTVRYLRTVSSNDVLGAVHDDARDFWTACSAAKLLVRSLMCCQWLCGVLGRRGCK